MKKTIPCFALLAACLFAACNVFFSNNAGEEGSLTLSLGTGGPSTATPDAGASFYLPVSNEDGAGGVFPVLGDSRIAVYNSAGKILRDYSFAQGQTSLQFSIPAGGPYWLDFSAPVVHPSNIETETNPVPAPDPFPFVKSFGATVKLDTVEKGSNQELFLPLRVRETAIMVPYRYSDVPNGGFLNTNYFTPFYDMPEKYPAYSPETERSSIYRGIEEICLEFDPYGRVFTMGKFIGESALVYRFDNFSSQGNQINTLPSVTGAHGLAFNLWNGRLYYAYRSLGGTYMLSEYDVSQASKSELVTNESSHLDSAIITIDEEGILYGLTNVGEETHITAREMPNYWKKEGIEIPLDAGTLEELLNFTEKPSKVEFFDLKALNGYLYALLCVHYQDDTTDHTAYYDCFAAIPLESIKQGNVKGSWYVGGQSVDELDDNQGSNSLEGFFGPKKFAGWGPERIYVYDYNGVDGETYHRIVEVDLLNRKISRAGLIADIKDLNN